MVRLKINGEVRSYPEEPTVAVVLESLALAGRTVAVELNGAIVPRAEHARRQLADGDELEIVTLVGGG